MRCLFLCTLYTFCGGDYVIQYKVDIMSTLKEAGYSSYKLRSEKIFGESTMTKFRNKEYINFENLNTLCKLLNCQPSELIEYVPDENA